MKKPTVVPALPPKAADHVIDESCLTCRFCQVGHCRRMPPTVVQATVMRGVEGDFAAGVWPQVELGDWCGEWQDATA